MADPTIYPKLNVVLRELVASARTILAENFCGAYLQGSFAVGDAGIHRLRTERGRCPLLVPDRQDRAHHEQRHPVVAAVDQVEAQ